jgi:hypothetical protein
MGEAGAGLVVRPRDDLLRLTVPRVRELPQAAQRIVAVRRNSASAVGSSRQPSRHVERVARRARVGAEDPRRVAEARAMGRPSAAHADRSPGSVNIVVS